MLSADKVSFSYGRRTVVDQVSVNIEPGKVIALLGPNGAGKTSLFRLLSGSVEPESGQVTLDGKPLKSYRADVLARRRAVLPQTSQLGFNFTVREVVEMGRLPHAKADKNVDEESVVELAMQWADIVQFADRHYMSLSGGERQRVQLARCLAQVWPGEGAGLESTYLMLDEPTNNLDISHQHTCLREARRLADKGVGVACILHDFNLALAYADSCVVIYDGMVRASGAVEKALTAEVVGDVFGVKATLIEQDGQRVIATLPK
ncbi:heme ABC transporter ATP-binding protein [Cerasicoccus frondis]|uniref:heme ABC transporter ATP-binding protein n=1 Tax=Cerasicoccus frondis TaxID=490090 RepID=UPI0028526CBF|nr:heme ABC transporter ATP-binding protein [Cerasicoccus frondis]